MEWTAERDATLAELYRKRLGNMFIASWMRLKPAEVRARLRELGLIASCHSTAAGNAVRPAAPESLSAFPVAGSGGARDDSADKDVGEDEDDDDGAMVSFRGRPKGHLMPESRIAALYRSVGRGY
jgi:hypothetical protein